MFRAVEVPRGSSGTSRTDLDRVLTHARRGRDPSRPFDPIFLPTGSPIRLSTRSCGGGMR